MLQNRFKRILVALDGSVPSRRGLNEAISLARQSEATITGIHVLPGFPRVIGMSKKSEGKIMARVRKIMSDARINAGRHGLEFDEKIIKSNDIVAAISNQAKAGRYDVIVIGSRGAGSPTAEYFGSVANGVLHDSSVPVLLIK
ncbi:MAG: universal stress protein [Thaumarchaeota archaeon]|nr:universal stress protein [Nitrososphaerota archaeon]